MLNVVSVRLVLLWCVFSQVYEFVQLPELFYAGSHGMDIMGPADGCNGFKASGTLAKDKKVNCQILHCPGPDFMIE